jgi:acetyltransferase-like isoleucine patch superfamily enzyme
MKYFIVVTYELVMSVLFSLPRYRFLNNFKAIFLRCLKAKIGKRVVFYPGVWIVPGRNLVIGNDVDLALDVLITTSGGVYIGDRTLIGYRTQIISGNHIIPLAKGQIFNSGHEYKPVHISEDVWVGANCIIMPGVTIGVGAVIAGGSVVTKDVPDFTVVAGVPAKIIKDRI